MIPIQLGTERTAVMGQPLNIYGSIMPPYQQKQIRARMRQADEDARRQERINIYERNEHLSDGDFFNLRNRLELERIRAQEPRWRQEELNRLNRNIARENPGFQFPIERGERVITMGQVVPQGTPVFRTVIGNTLSEPQPYWVIPPPQPPPPMKTGGSIKKTGVYTLHKGEVVVPANRVKSVDKSLKKDKKALLKK